MDQVTKLTKNVPKPSRKRKSNLWLHKPKKSKTHHTVCDTECETSSASTISTPPNRVQPCSANLRNAPLKAKRKLKKTKRKLYEENVNDKIINEMIDILPSVLIKLRQAGISSDFCNLLRLIHLDKLPLTNISLLLFLDVVRWYSLENTSNMQYSIDCLKFWKVMYRLFHGKALRFMGGMKSSKEDVDESNTANCGGYDPAFSSINFAVPSQKRLTAFDGTAVDLPNEIPPGIISESLAMKPLEKSYILSFDGKKLAPGLNENWGDQDLFGHEEIESLNETKKRLEHEINYIDKTVDAWSNLEKHEQIDKLQNIVTFVSSRLKDLRHLVLKQQFALKKFLKEGGPDWRNSKYVYAISSIQAQLFQLQSSVKKLLCVNNSLLSIGASINGASDKYTSALTVDLFSQRNIITLKDFSDLPENMTEELRFIKQRSPQWFKVREQFRLTGSSLHEGLGLESLKLQQRHFDKVVRKIETSEAISEDVAKRMEHGTMSEVHAIATLIAKILPFYYPDLTYVEEGAHVIRRNEAPFILVSPDGSLGKINLDGTGIPLPLIGCEFKCPSPSEYKTPVHYEIPVRYLPQVLSEMASMNVSELLYLCWTEESSTVFRVTFDAVMWTSIIQEADAVYFPDEPKRPTRLSSESKNIKENLLKYREKNCKFLCEISSVKGTRVGSFYDIEESPYIYPICSLINPTDEVNNNIDVISNSVKSCIMDAFQVCRKKATEVLVWILADTDRIFSKGIPYALPVAYAMKGYSLGTQVMREMHEHVLQACYEKNLRVVASCFDGQWTKLATRDKKGKPLTEMQLQRDVYGDASKMSRDAIVRKLTSESIIDVEKSNLQIKKTNFGLTVSCQRLKRIMQSLRNKLRKTKTSIAPNEEDDTTSCLPDEALETLLDEDNSTQINSMFNLQNPSEAEEVKEVLDDSNNSRTVNPKIPEETVELILLNLKSHSNRNVSKKWTNKTINEMKETLVSRHLLMKMQHDEMNVVIEATKVLHNMGSKMIRKSCSREEKAKQIKKMFVGREDETWEKTVKKMMPLKCIASTIVRGSSTKIPKERLNNTVAAMLYDTKYDEWREESTFKLKTRIENADTTKWFSFPEFSEERQQIEPKCLDAHHLLVNLRCKVCKDGLVGIRKEAWHQVAEKNNAVISNAIVVDLVDKQNNAFAKRTFSKAVEDEMRKLKYSTEADFCRLIRQWYESEDSGGIAAIERVQRKLELKSFLLKDVDFGIFPPPGMYIKGFPKVMFEGFIQRIDTSIQLYDIVKGQSYNQRSLSSLVNETFFGELSELEPTKLGCPKAVSIPRLMANVTEMQHFRCDPSNRVFHICTTRKSVYPKDKLLIAMDKEKQEIPGFCSPGSATMISPRNHAFDDPKLFGKRQRKSKRSDISQPSAVCRGCLPVRQHHRCDESKILPTTRLGIPLQDNLK